MQLEINGYGVTGEIKAQPSIPGRPCLIFIHGAQNDHSVWAQIVPAMSLSGYRVALPDLPGHGESEGPPLATVEGLADWLGAFIQKVAAGDTAPDQHPVKFTLIGHSMGSLVALECAARFQAFIASVVLVCTAIPMKVSPTLLALAESDEAAAITQVNLWSHAPPPPTAEAQRLRDELMTESRQVMARQKAGVLHTDLSACNDYQNGLTTAAAVHCPTLVIAGSRDLMTPPKFTGDLLAALPNAQLHTIEDAGHAMMSESPAALISALTRFLEQ